MRAYLAVIKDAFRAAVAAKLLYVTFALIVLFLLALVPLSYREQVSFILRLDDIKNPAGIAQSLYDESSAASEAPASEAPASEAPVSEEVSEEQNDNETPPQSQTPLGYVWSRLPESTQTQVTNFADPLATGQGETQIEKLQRIDILRQRFRNDFATLIKDPEFYKSDVFAGVELGSEAAELAQKDPAERSELESRRLNRLVFDALLPFDLGKADDTMLQFTYLGLSGPGDGFVLSRGQLDLLTTTTLPWILDKLVLSIGVLVAILFTANMVPELLEPGSLNLLLSKPVRRWGLFISKYLGACVFAFLNALLLFLGLWLILGFRLDIWNPAFLACIPIYVFVFAIYYSLSALVGLVFRSPILSIVSALLFWLFCFVVGLADQTMSSLFEDSEATRLAVTADHYIMFDEESRASLFPKDGDRWQRVFRAGDFGDMPAFVRGIMPGSSMYGPIWDASKSRFIAAQQPSDELGATFSTNRKIVVATEAEEWNTRELMLAPRYTRAVFQSGDDGLIIVTYFGKIYRLPYTAIDAYLGEMQTKQESSGDDAAEPESIGAKPESSDTEADGAARRPDDEYFIDVSPEFALAADQVQKIAKDLVSDDLLVFGGNGLLRLKWDGSRYTWTNDDRLILPVESASTAIALVGDTAVLGEADRAVYIADFATGQVVELSWEASSAIVSVTLEPTGVAAAILDSKGKLWQLDLGQRTLKAMRVRAQGKIRSLSSGDENKSWIIDAYSRVASVDPIEGRIVDVGATKMSTLQAVHVYGLHPVYWLSPKPGEFYKVVGYLARMWPNKSDDEEDAEASAEDLVREQLEQSQQVSNQQSPWMPVWNGLGFIALMLGLAVWYFERQDF